MNAMPVYKILVIEDYVHFADFLKDKLAAEYELEFADNADVARQKFQPGVYDLVLLDLVLPQRPGQPVEIIGFDILKSIKTIDPAVEVIVLTGVTREIDRAIQAIKEGAYHFLIKDDYSFPEKLHTTIQNALEKRALERQNRALAHENRALAQKAKYFAEYQRRVHKHLHPELNYHYGLLLGESEPMQEIYATIEKLSERSPDETILIGGEPGTGKDLTALSIHALSPRGNQPWIVAYIAALPASLMESELFGIEAKIATGVNEKAGYFEQADGSSIFLDEVGDVPPEVQAKLLRVLEQKEIQRVGSTARLTVDARVIAATNRNLGEMMAQGKFREDLYFRLNVVPITLSPLRERQQDIPILIRHFCHFIQQEEKNPHFTLTDDAVEFLQAHDWPGNIRELKNLIRKASILRNHDILTAADFRKLLPRSNSALVSNHAILESLPSLRDLSPAGETASFKNLRDGRLRHKILLRTLIAREGSMEEVLKDLDIARNTGYKFLENAQNLLLTGLCQTECNVKQLALSWGVESNQLEITLRWSNRLNAYLLELQKRFEHDLKRLAAFLNVKVEQLVKAAQYLNDLQK